MNQAIQKQSSGMVHTESLTETTLANEQTIATVLAARAKAEVEARFVVAIKRPRNWLQVRRQLLEACDRPGFADGGWGSGWWERPVGNQSIEGFSIRFAEEALRCMGNMDARATVIFDDPDLRLILVEVIDLENNISVPTTIPIDKTVERKFLKKGEVAISERLNSYGQKVYLRGATDEEVLSKQNSAISKAMRNGIMRLLPGDIQAECKQRILEIRHGAAAKDPKAFLKAVTDGFGELNISPDNLEEYLGHELKTCSPDQLSHLRDVYKAIKDGETTWKQLMDSQGAEEGPPKEAKNLSDLTSQMKQKDPPKGSKKASKGKKGKEEEPQEDPQRDEEGRLL